MTHGTHENRSTQGTLENRMDHENKITHGTRENKMTHGTHENKMKHGTLDNKMKNGSHENGNFLGEINRRFYLCQNEIFQNRSRQQKSDENQKHQSMTAKMKRIKSNGGKD